MRNIMVGLTHNEAGEPIIRAPRTLKVGIGIPKGRGIRVFIHPSGEWYVVKADFASGKMKENSSRFKSRSEAEAFFHTEKDTAPVVGYPRKLAFFTFSKPVITKDGGEAYEPDFDAIEAAGPVPTQIKVVFMSAEPFEGAYQMWSATELKCRGNGIDAMRSVAMEPNNSAAQKAKAAGLRVFPIENGCWQRGCPYANKECKVGSSLNFQLARSVRVGGTAFFHTTGFRSTKDIFSSLEEIKTIVMLATGKTIACMPMWLKLRPYITKPEGKPAATQYAVRVEMDAVEIGKLQSKLIEQSFQAQTLQIAASTEAVEVDEDDLPVSAQGLSAQAMADEFYPEAEEMPEPQPVQKAATTTQAKQADVGAKLKAQREKADATPVAERVVRPEPTGEPAAPESVTQAATVSTPTVSFPWSDRAQMNSMLIKEKERVGDKTWDVIFKRIDIMGGALKVDDVKALKLYNELKAAPDAGDLF